MTMQLGGAGGEATFGAPYMVCSVEFRGKIATMLHIAMVCLHARRMGATNF